MEYLTTELEHMETRYEGLYRSLQEHLKEFKAQKSEKKKLETKYLLKHNR